MKPSEVVNIGDILYAIDCGSVYKVKVTGLRPKSWTAQTKNYFLLEILEIIFEGKYPVLNPIHKHKRYLFKTAEEALSPIIENCRIENIRLIERTIKLLERKKRLRGVLEIFQNLVFL